MTLGSSHGEVDDDHEPASVDVVRSASESLAEQILTGLIPTGLSALGSTHAITVAGPVLVPSGSGGEGREPVVVEWGADLPPYRVEDRSQASNTQVLDLLATQEGALGDYLEQLPPGPALGRLLGAIDLDDVDDYALVEVVAAYKRMEAWSAAKAARAAAVLAEREALNPTWPGTIPGRTRGECVAGQELSMRLRVSKLAAARLAACGRAFTGLFHLTGEALEQGLIDFPRAQAIVSTLEGLPSEVALAAQWAVLDRAPGRTLRQVHQDLAAAVIAADPDHADARHVAAKQKRCVNRPRPLPDGMAHVSAVLPAADAVALDIALDAAARAARNNGDSRTLDQLRADTLALMGHTALALGHVGPDAAAHCTCGCAPPSATSTGLRPPGPPGGEEAPDAVASPGGDTPKGKAPPSAADAPAGAGPRTHAPRQCVGGPPVPGHRLPGSGLPTIRLGMLAGGRADIRVTVPLGVLLPAADATPCSPLERLPEQVAELEGYGPVPPVIARALAAGGEWRRLVTDPTGTQVLDVGRRSYQPTVAIADHVRERDRTCVVPGCSTPSRSCQLDHEHEWQDGGVTSVGNLGPLCTRDHPVKSIGAFTVAHSTDRTYAWTTPTGHGYLRRPDGTILTLPRRTAEGLRAHGREVARAGRSVDPAVVDAVLAEVSAGTATGGSWTPAEGAPAAPWPGLDHGPSWAGDDDPPF